MKHQEGVELKALRILEKEPKTTQRALSKELDMSLGKAHYLLKSLIEVGLVKLSNFKRSDNKIGYAYVLTPRGVAEKANITVRFLRQKEQEFKSLKSEIDRLKAEVSDLESDESP